MDAACHPEQFTAQKPAVSSSLADGVDNKPPRKKPKQGYQQPTINLPPGGLPDLKVPRPPAPPPGGWASTLMRRLAEWAAASGRVVLGGLGVFVLAMLSPLDAGVANEWEHKLPEEDENRYRELEAKRSAALAKGQQLPPQEEAEWQALEDRKFPAGRDGGSSKRMPQRKEIDPKRTGHIFRDEEGHLPDTPENRQKLEDVANNPEARLGTDVHGNEWYAEVQPDGSQIWIIARNGKIINAGSNNPPKPFNSNTGLSAPTAPGYYKP